MLLGQVQRTWQLQRKVIPPSKGHGSNDEKEKEINIGYDTQGKSLLNYLYLTWNVSLLFLSVRKSKKKIIVYPPSSQEDSFSEKKIPLRDKGPEVSKVQHIAKG